MSILRVGAGQQFSTLAKAVAAAQDGDTIAVQAGTYTNDFATITKDVTIVGVGGVAKFVATIAPPNGKGILVTRADVTVRNLEFSGARVADDNGAGIRYEGGNLTVENSYFHHNQMGLLSNSVAGGTITIRNSEFAYNGGGDGYTHSLYVNGIHSLTVENSYFHDASNGHHIKSRALNTTIVGNRILDGNGTSSYNIDLPNGGNALIKDNVIHQNAKSPNVAIVSFGAEGNLKAVSALKLVDNLVVDDHLSTNVKLVSNRTATAPVEVVGTEVWGLTSSQMSSGPATVADTIFLAARPTLDTTSTWNVTTAPVGDPVPTPTPTPVPAPSTITGTDGTETLTGTAGADTLNGLGGADKLVGGAGADRMIGGSGSDTYYVDDAGDIVVENTKEGVDKVVSTVDHELASFVEDLTLSGTASIDGTGNSWHNVLHGNSGANRLSGLAGDDKLHGEGGNDHLLGGDGTDRLYGGSGNDRLEGGIGADFLQGGGGTDTLVGGSGADTFDWNVSGDLGTGAARDVILDFMQGSDKIDLSGIDALRGTTTNDMFTFIGNQAFHGVSGELRFTSGSGFAIVQGDTNGDSIADFELRLDGVASLQPGDFVL